MAVKAVVVDLDGTLLRPDGSPVPGAVEMLDELRNANVKIAIASNRSQAPGRVSRAALPVDLILDRHLVGENKGSPLWVAVACQTFGAAPNELVWLGDDDRTDMRSAVNAHVIYFNAAWSNPQGQYGIMVHRPNRFSTIVREFFMRDRNWHWSLSASDREGRQVLARAVVDAYVGNRGPLYWDLLGSLKDQRDLRVGPMRVREFATLHLLGSIYAESLHLRTDTWTIYPGHLGGVNVSLRPMVSYAARTFRDKFVADLLIRHVPAVDSGTARRGGQIVPFTNQFNTMRLNDQHRERIAGKRILVVDDFETRGYSMECARNLLLMAGAEEVICASVGKYPRDRSVISPVQGYKWDPFAATQHAAKDFHLEFPASVTDAQVTTLVNDSYRRFSQLTNW